MDFHIFEATQDMKGFPRAPQAQDLEEGPPITFSTDPLQKEGKLPSAQGRSCTGSMLPAETELSTVPSGQKGKGSVSLGQQEVMKNIARVDSPVPQVQLQNQV